VTNQELWQTVLGELEISLSRANFTTWFKNTSILDRDAETVTVGVPNIFTKEWLENKYHAQIKSALQKALGADGFKEIIYHVGSRSPLAAEAAVMLETATAEPVVSTGTGRGPATNLNPRYHLDSFVIGSSNKLAFAATTAVAQNLGTTYNPLFLYGGVGLGKTHLLHAVGNEVLKRQPEKRVLYVTSERFTNEMIGAISSRRTTQFKDRYRKIDLLLIDDIQFLAGKEGTQEEFFHTFNALHEDNKQIIISSDRPPKDIPTLEDRLRSRFEWGMIADIGAPDLETRLAILRSKRDSKGYEVSEEVLDYLAKHIQNNIRELEGALTRIVAYSELNGSAPTIEVAKNVLGNILANPRRRAVSAPQIIERVAALYNLEPDELTGPKRDKPIVHPRQIAMYLMREELSLSYPRIGAEFGGRDHTTAMHAVSKITQGLELDDSLRHEVNLARERLYIS
jgi:chromosomal replication initiator protein